LENGLDINLLFFSFEMNADSLMAKLMSLYIWDTYQKIVPYSTIMSLVEPIGEEDFKLVCDSKAWLETIEKHITIIDTPITPQQCSVVLRMWNERFGEFIESDNDQESYVPKNPTAFNAVIVDHVKLTKDNGKGAKNTIDELCNEAIFYRNKCGNSFYLVQQINRNSKSMDRRMNGFELLQLDDLSDSSGTAQASEIVIGLFNPHRERRVKLEGYNIRELGDRARTWQCLKNRYGQSDKNVMLAFYGEIGYFKELPKAEDLVDYDDWKELDNSIKPQEPEQETTATFNFSGFIL
jgi:hypothetical protein